MRSSRALGMAIGFVADRLLGDPSTWHPVAGFGQLAAKAEQVTYQDNRSAGVKHVSVLVGGAVGLGMVAERATRNKPWARTAATALTIWAVLGGATLAKEATGVGDVLRTGDLSAARRQVGRIVGRDTSELTEADIARATVETVAENTSDAVVAPLFWGAVAGVPGLVGYRAINTLDAMVGYKSAKYLNFGWAAAKLDDAANYLPARLTAVLVAVARPTRAREVLRIVRRDAEKHPSPNAGVVEAAFAGACDLRLGGANSYGEQVENRGTLGDGAPPTAADIGRVTRLSARVQWLAAGVAVGLVACLRGR